HVAHDRAARPRRGEHATAAPSAPHAAPWASGPVVRDMPSVNIAPWTADETEQIAPLPQHRWARAIAVIAALVVVAALIIALRPPRAARHAPPTATITPMLPAVPPAIDAGVDAAAPAAMASAPAQTIIEPPARTVARPPR